MWMNAATARVWRAKNLVDCFILQVDPSISPLPAFGGALGNLTEGLRQMGLMKGVKTEITLASELYFAHAGGNP